MASAVELKGVSAGYGDTVVLEDVNLAIAPGESISVIGRNGVGKTTLLSTIMGHTTLHKGEVLLAGKSLNRVPVFRRAAAGVPSAESHIILDAIDALPKNIGVLIIDHDMDLVFRFANRIVVLAEGAVLADGSPDEIRRDPKVRAAYLGN